MLSNPWLDLWWQGVVHSPCEVVLHTTNTHTGCPTIPPETIHVQAYTTHMHKYRTKVCKRSEGIPSKENLQTHTTMCTMGGQRKTGVATLHYCVLYIEKSSVECRMRMLFTVLLTALTATSGEDTHNSEGRGTVFGEGVSLLPVQEHTLCIDSTTVH